VYYSDISNSELQQFHNQKVQNFTIKLSDALTSPLFKIEEVIAGNVYKIYPLFYANEITSTNPNDKILDNKCIICQKQTDENTNKETYFSFISDPDSEINDYTEYGQYYDIGDSLTTNEFNAIISLLRQNTINTGQFELNNGTLHGAYADYEFDIEDSTLLDTGIVVTDETITSQPRVKLTNPLFKWSKYLLKLDVIHYTGVNVLDDETGDFKVVETLEVELVKDEWVDIPVSSFEEGYIISLTANIEISHNEPIIRMLKGLRVTGNPEIIQSNETTDLTAQLLDQNGYDYDVSESEGITVHFYEIITPSLTGLIANPNIIAIDETSDITVQVMDEDGSKVTGETVHFYAVKGIDPTPGHSYRLVVESDVDVLSYYDEDSAILSATLTDNNIGVSGETVNFMKKEEVFRDGGITGDSSAEYWAWNSSYVSQSVGSTGTTVTNSDNSDRVYTLRKSTSGTQYEVFSRFCSFEFDLISVTGNVQIQQRIGTTQKAYNLTETGHYKIINDDEYINIYCNDVLKDRLENTMTGLHQIRFGMFGVGNFTYKNFKVLDDEIFDTATTDVNGVATVSYVSKGAGDLNIHCEALQGSLVSEIYSVSDCIIANVNVEYTGTSTSDTVYSLGYDQIADLSSTDFEMTWDFKQTSYGCDVCLGASSEFSVSPIKSNYRVFIGNSGGGNTRQGYRTTSTTNTNGSISGEVSLNTVHNMKIVKEGSTFSYYLGTKLLGTRTVSFWSDYNMFGVHTVQWNKGTTTISNLKIKPL